MNRVITILTSLCICMSCVDRTGNANFTAKVSAVLEVQEMITGDNTGGIGVAETVSRTYSDDSESNSDKETVAEAVFYIFDETDALVFENSFAGADSYNLDLPRNGRYAIYVLCNMSALIDMPEAPTRGELEAMNIPHCESYDHLPFAGKTQAVITGDTPEVKICLNRINSAIRIENRNTDRVEIVNATVSGLPSRGNIFATGTEATGVEYSESAEAMIDADGNAVAYSFFVPEKQMTEVKIEAGAVVKGKATEATALAPLAFIDRLEAGKQSTALVGYVNNDLKIGGPDNWGNIGEYELSGGVRLHVVGGEFFTRNNVKALRAYSSGCAFVFTVSATEGAASLRIADGATDWLTINDGIITVSPNTTASERECRIAVSVGGNNAGMFCVVQGKAIAFTGASGTNVENDRVEIIGGQSAAASVKFDISSEELDGMEIVPVGNGENGVTVTVDRKNKTISASFMAHIDASEVSAEGVSVPVKFMGLDGAVHATLTFVQRPAVITFDPVIYGSLSSDGGTISVSVTVEGDARWAVKDVTYKGESTEGGWLTKILPSASAASGSNFEYEAAPNAGSNSRTAYIRVESRNTVSKPYTVTQLPSYGVKEISAECCWDNTTGSLKTYSKGRAYKITFETETAVPAGMKLTADCNPSGGITVGEIYNVSGNGYAFTLTVPDSDNADEEVACKVNISADGATIGTFTVLRAYKPSFVSEDRDVYGGVRNRPELKTVVYRASEWDIKDFVSSNDKLSVTKLSSSEIEIGYAETLKYDDAAQEATVTMNLNGGNKAEYITAQRPVTFAISDDDLDKLAGVDYDGGDIGVTVVAKAGSSDVSWRVSSASDAWFSTTPSAGGSEINASGSVLTVRFTPNSGNNRTGSFVIESLNTTSPAYVVLQRGPLSAVVNSVTYNGKQAVFADGMLKAFSVGYDYTVNIVTSNSVAGGNLSVVNNTAGSAVTVKTQPSGTALATAHSFVITVPASDVATEQECVLDILSEGGKIGELNVKQAKKAGFAASTGTVNVTSVIGGVESRPALKNGRFIASEWDVVNVTSGNASLPVSSVDIAAGTFIVGFAATLTDNSATQSATITLSGADGISRGSYTTSQSKVSYTLPAGVSLNAIADTAVVTVVSSNAGAISSGMTATSNASWCKVSATGDEVTVTATANTANASRSASVYVTYWDSRSQSFTVTQMAPDLTTVHIGGADWKIYNVNSRGNLATALPSQCSGMRTNSLGQFYQWGRNVAWNNSSSSVSGWNTAEDTNNYSEWPSGTNPCPSGFKVPSDTDFKNLSNACIVKFYNDGNGWSADNYGYITLISKTNTNVRLEFPATGRRPYWGGNLTSNGTNGFYWTSVGDPTNTVNAHDIGFNSGSITFEGNDNKRNGFSIRCVRQ